jgi:hypothetical protein
VPALLLPAVDGARRETSVALSAHLLLAVEGSGEGGESGIVDSTAKTQHQVQRAFLLDVVVRKGASVLELLACKNQTLLIGGDALLVLDLGLDIVNAVRRLHVERDGFAREGLDEDLFRK